MSKDKDLPKVTIRELLDAGIHFGHKAFRWNPKMAPYIYGVKDDLHIIDLQQTVGLLEIAMRKIYDTVKNNGKILFVSTKIQAKDLIAEYVEKCGQYYVNNRWLGGMLTNLNTISRSIKKLEEFEALLADEEVMESYTKKEILDITRKKDKLLRSLGGIRQMGSIPDLLVVIDTNKEHIAVSEAVKLKIPVIAVLDTNSDPDDIDYPVPGNDDAIRSIRLYCQMFSDAAIAGIQDAMIESGIDVNVAKDVNLATKSETDGVTKIKKGNKVSKVLPL